jgi:hypothetical protein
MSTRNGSFSTSESSGSSSPTVARIPLSAWASMISDVGSDTRKQSPCSGVVLQRSIDAGEHRAQRRLARDRPQHVERQALVRSITRSEVVAVMRCRDPAGTRHETGSVSSTAPVPVSRQKAREPIFEPDGRRQPPRRGIGAWGRDHVQARGHRGCSVVDRNRRRARAAPSGRAPSARQ